MTSQEVFKDQVREMENRANQLRDASVVAARALLEIIRDRPEDQQRLQLKRMINICGPEGDWHDTILAVELGVDGELFLVTENGADQENLADQEPSVIQEICSDLYSNSDNNL